MKTMVLGSIAMLIVAFAPTASAVPQEEQATTLPGGLYLYSFGGPGFPQSHGWQLWMESNGVTGCGVNEGLPMWHVFKATGTTDLQVRAGQCGASAADTQLTP